MKLREETGMRGLVGNLKNGYCLEDLGVNERMVLKMGLIQLKLGTNDGLLWKE
jgi:hypothetical protein